MKILKEREGAAPTLLSRRHPVRIRIESGSVDAAGHLLRGLGLQVTGRGVHLYSRETRGGRAPTARRCHDRGVLFCFGVFGIVDSPGTLT